MKIIRLKPIIEDKSEYDEIEKRIIELFKKEIYEPILKMLNSNNILINSYSIHFLEAIKSGEIYYSKGAFRGKFNSRVSKELIKLGAKFDSKTASYKIKMSDLPFEVRTQVSFAKASFDGKIERINKFLDSNSFEKISEKLKVAKLFDKTLFKVDKEFVKNVENIIVTPKLTSEQREQISREWENNLKLYIKNFTDEQILDLRKKVSENVLAGNRRENLIKTIQESYNVSENKAKFLARQETNLMMAKFKETRYVNAGVPEYEWRCVHMPHQSSPTSIYKPGEVRYSHGILEGKIFSWQNPPVTTPPSQPARRNNPGQDYNCRCFAIPVVRFK